LLVFSLTPQFAHDARSQKPKDDNDDGDNTYCRGYGETNITNIE